MLCTCEYHFLCSTSEDRVSRLDVKGLRSEVRQPFFLYIHFQLRGSVLIFSKLDATNKANGITVGSVVTERGMKIAGSGEVHAEGLVSTIYCR